MTTEEASKPEVQANETSAGNTESDDSLPELVSDDTETEADDSGYVFLNTSQSTGEEDTSTEDEEKEMKKQVLRARQKRRRGPHERARNGAYIRHGRWKLQTPDNMHRPDIPANRRAIFY